MRKILLFLSLFFALGVMSGCVSEEVPEKEEEKPDPNNPNNPNNPDPEKKDRTFKMVVFGQLSNRLHTYAEVDLFPPSPTIVWNNTYETPELNVGVFVKDAAGAELCRNQEVKLNSWGNEQASNTITVTTDKETGSVYAYYPYQTSVNGTVLSHTIKNVQDQSVKDSTMDSQLNPNMLMVAPPTSSVVLNGGDANVELRSVFPILRFRVNFGDKIINNPIKYIQVYIAHKDDLATPLDYTLAGDYQIDLSKAPGTSGFAGATFTKSQSVITATLTGSQSISSDLTLPSVWMITNAVTIAADHRLVAIVDFDMQHLPKNKIVSVHDIRELKSNTIHDIHIVSRESNVVSDQVFLHSEVSNCYIILKPQMNQIFLKTVNGTPLYGHSVDWLWASKEGGGTDFDITELIDTSSFHLTPEQNPTALQFRVGSKLGKYTKGNVMLALKDESGHIVWTWHIWMTDQPQDIEYGNDKKFMDRNIGAMSAEKDAIGIDHYGFLYQWGRKDPFIGGDGHSNETQYNMLELARKNTIVNEAAFKTDVAKWKQDFVRSSSGRMDFAKTHPMGFISNDDATLLENASLADWLISSIPTLWFETGKEKTDYDPCPSGYKVPSFAEMNALYEAAQNPSSMQYFRREDNKRYWEYYHTEGGSDIWPTAGMRQGRFSTNQYNGAQLIDAGSDNEWGNCYYWSSTPAPVGINPGGAYRLATSGKNLLLEQAYGDKADAYPIRCVKIETTP